MRPSTDLTRLVFASFAALLLLGVPFNGLAASDVETDAHRLVGLLEYVGADYRMAVKDGEVINDFEYNEMHVLVSDAKELLAGQATQPEAIEKHLQELSKLIEQKAPVPKVEETAQAAKRATVSSFDIALAPDTSPRFERGKELYRNNCVSCHGKAGKANGPAAEGMEPPVADFTNAERRAALSPYRVYNTVRFGIDGTPMNAYEELNTREKWDIAFYTMALGHGAQEHPRSSTTVSLPEGFEPTLDMLAKQSDDAVAATLQQAGMSTEASAKAVTQLRTETTYTLEPGASAAATQNAGDERIITALNLLKKAEASWKDGQNDEARKKVLAAYLDGFEMAEPRLRSLDSGLVRSVEEAIFGLRTALKNGNDDAVERHLADAREHLAQARSLLSEGGSVWAAGFASAIIILREGVEIVLLVTLLLGILTRLNRTDAKKYVHGGWIAAIVAGGITWYLAQTLIDVSGASREVIEGVVGLLAAAVLFSVSYWFMQSLHGKQFLDFIKGKLEEKATAGHMMAIGGVSFLAVYREAFETVLFYQALFTNTDGGMSGIVVGGAIGLMILAVIAYFILSASRKLPMKQFFAVSAVLLFGLCIMLVGSGLHAFVEAGYLPMIAVPFVTIDWLGIHSNLIPLAGQALMLVAGLVWAGYSLSEPTDG
jgi:high-affinity iron transporter